VRKVNLAPGDLMHDRTYRSSIGTKVYFPKLSATVFLFVPDISEGVYSRLFITLPGLTWSREKKKASRVSLVLRPQNLCMTKPRIIKQVYIEMGKSFCEQARILAI
jgi:hypothetical protein